jgi:Ca-activated chloride channel family protein
MKPLRRTNAQAARLLSLVFILISLNAVSGLAQQNQEATAQAPPSSSVGGDNSVMLRVTVTDSQRHYVKGLTRANFAVFDGKQEQQIKAFSDSDEPLSVGILFDASSSVKSKRLKFVRDALARFFQLSNPSNEYFVVTFNDKIKMLQDWTSDVESILKSLDTIQPIENTRLFDACHIGVAKVLTGQHQRHVLILLSDGQDNDSKRSFAQLRRLLEETDVLLYSVGLLVTDDPGSSLGLEGQAILDELASTTGGVAFFPSKAKETDVIFERIANELHNQYSISFTPTVIDGKRHKLKLRVTPLPYTPREMQKLTVRSRMTFYTK